VRGFVGRATFEELSGALGFAGAVGFAIRGVDAGGTGLAAGFGGGGAGGGGSVGRAPPLTVNTCWQSKFGQRIFFPACSGSRLNFVLQWGHCATIDTGTLGVVAWWSVGYTNSNCCTLRVRPMFPIRQG